jgi:guanylate cyclase
MKTIEEAKLVTSYEKIESLFSVTSLPGRALHSVTNIAIVEEDSNEEKLQKALLSLLAFFGFIAGLCLGIHDLVYEYPTKGLITFSYSAVTLIGFIHLKYTKQFRLFRFTQLAFILTMPFLAQVTHGGFILSGSAIIWSLGSPICAVFFNGPQKSVRWFIAYALLVILSACMDSTVSQWEGARTLTASPWFFVGHLLGISVILFMLMQFFTYRIKSEQERSEALLLNILPKPIAERLKNTDEQIADEFNDATILFADIVGFTELSEKMSANEVVKMLNSVFSCFDELADKFGLEKIKTIGDAYMVVGGLPVPRQGSSEKVLKMALAMIESMIQFNKESELKLKLRIGIHTGPVVAGVIGIRKFIYDLWGDAVNVASRMESTGVEGKIQVTEDTFLRHREKFEFEKRGTIVVQGKGEMSTWFLTGKITSDEEKT